MLFVVLLLSCFVKRPFLQRSILRGVLIHLNTWIIALHEGLNGSTSIALNTYFFWMYNIKQLIFSHFNTNIKKFVVTFFFSHKQTNHILKGEISMLGLCLLYQSGFFGHFPTIRDYFKTSEEWTRYPKAAEDFRKLSKMSEGCRRCPNTAEDV